MWEPLARARRRLLGDVRPALATDFDDISADLSYALGRGDLERLIAALGDVPGVQDARPDTPARLEAALGRAISGAGGRGIPVVTRRPAGVYTPEAWHIAVSGADARTRAELDRAIRGGGLA